MREWDQMIARQVAADGVRSESGHHIRTPVREIHESCPVCGGNGTESHPWYGNCRAARDHFNQGDEQ